MSIVSLTELRLKSFWDLPRFAFHATKTSKQSKQAPGNLKTTTSTRGWRTHLTMTLWADRKAKIKYKSSGAHRDAVLIFPKIATGRIYSFESSELPSWSEAESLLQKNGHEV